MNILIISIFSRLQNGMEFNSFNWKNCTMHVQDIIFPGTNVTAEISEEAAKNFKKMCKMFASTALHDQIIDEYLQNVSQLRSAILSSSSFGE